MSVPSGFILELYAVQRNGVAFLALQDALESPCAFPASVLEPALSLRSPGSFHWRTKPKSEHQVSSLLLECHCL